MADTRMHCERLILQSYIPRCVMYAEQGLIYEGGSFSIPDLVT